MNDNKWKGAITVYLSIILSAVLILCGLLIDIARIRTAQVQVQRAVNTAAASALAGYNSKLKEDYGLFALHSSDTSRLEDTIAEYLNKNLAVDIENSSKSNIFLKSMFIDNQFKNVRYINIYDYQIESIDITPIYNFTENEITRHQILEYMKYRAPVQLTESFIEKVKYAANTEKLTDAYKQKTAIEKKLGKLEKSLVKLQLQIDEINKFDRSVLDSSKESALAQLVDSTVQKEAYRICLDMEYDNISSTDEEKAAVRIKKQVREAYKASQKSFENSLEYINSYIQQYRSTAEKALAELDKIEALSKSAREDIENLKRFQKQEDNQNSTGKDSQADINSVLNKDISKYEQLLNAQNSKSVYNQLNINYNALCDIQNKLPVILPWINSETDSLRPGLEQALQTALQRKCRVDIRSCTEYNTLISKLMRDEKLKSIDKSARSFCIVSNVKEKQSQSKAKDPRKSTAETAKKLRIKTSEAENASKEIADMSFLPSYYAKGRYPNKLFSDQIFQEATNIGTENVVEEFDVDFEEESSFTEDTFDFISRFAHSLKDIGINMRNEIYVNEYILKIFKDDVEIKASSTDGKSSSSFFKNGEVEYILHGKSKETVNKYLVKGEISLIRMGMNTLHVYSDSTKRTQALELATAAAGVTGFGVPIVHNLLMCAWGTAEAFCDIDDIYNGKKVPFIKTADSWKTDLVPGGFRTKDNTKGQKNIMDFDYHDYLRLLLLVEDKETKMNRVEDLIELNMQQQNPSFKLNSCNTYIKVNAQVSIRYWFITNLFVLNKDKTSDNRHRINIELWKGY